MTITASDNDQNDDKRKTVAEFKEAVNITPARLRKWLASEESERVGQNRGGGESVGYQSGRRMIELLHKPAADLSEDDLVQRRKVVGYIRRHLTQGPNKLDPAPSDWHYSVMN